MPKLKTEIFVEIHQITVVVSNATDHMLAAQVLDHVVSSALDTLPMTWGIFDGQLISHGIHEQVTSKSTDVGIRFEFRCHAIAVRAGIQRALFMAFAEHGFDPEMVI